MLGTVRTDKTTASISATAWPEKRPKLLVGPERSSSKASRCTIVGSCLVRSFTPPSKRPLGPVYHDVEAQTGPTPLENRRCAPRVLHCEPSSYHFQGSYVNLIFNTGSLTCFIRYVIRTENNYQGHAKETRNSELSLAPSALLNTRQLRSPCIFPRSKKGSLVFNYRAPGLGHPSPQAQIRNEKCLCSPPQSKE
ncbi:hypothetical protein VTK26DRAFT_8013 [Humicola hyalothermophila]